MKKTTYMATLIQTQQGRDTHIDRRVYEDDNGKLFVKIYGEYFSVSYLLTHGTKVDCWQS